MHRVSTWAVEKPSECTSVCWNVIANISTALKVVAIARLYLNALLFYRANSIVFLFQRIEEKNTVLRIAFETNYINNMKHCCSFTYDGILVVAFCILHLKCGDIVTQIIVYRGSVNWIELNCFYFLVLLKMRSINVVVNLEPVVHASVARLYRMRKSSEFVHNHFHCDNKIDEAKPRRRRSRFIRLCVHFIAHPTDRLGLCSCLLVLLLFYCSNCALIAAIQFQSNGQSSICVFDIVCDGFTVRILLTDSNSMQVMMHTPLIANSCVCSKKGRTNEKQ